MFLANTSPLVALRRKWEPFARARSCQCPACFSKSDDDGARTSVSSKVQMIINDLQSKEPPLGATTEYGCILHGQRKGVKFRGRKLRGTATKPVQGWAECAQGSCPADSDGMEVDESSEFGPLLLNSDSDDSVDQEIEEAIQEYLKNKGQRIPPLPDSTKSLPCTRADKSLQKEHPSYAVACDVFPASMKADVIRPHLAPDFLDPDSLQWACSPCSGSSDDSFEQSIKAEIEQFLHEKKRQARNKVVSEGSSKNLGQKEAPEKLTSQKTQTSKASPGSLKRGGQALLFRRRPELLNSTTPPRCLMRVKKTSQVFLKVPGAGHSCILEQSNDDDDEVRQKYWKTGEQGPENAGFSDSSSDDGIEEAIRLYQLEKVRKEANAHAACFPAQKEEFGAAELADISTHLSVHSEKSTLPENPRTALNSKRKHLRSKPTELNRTGAVFNDLEKSRCCPCPANSLASGAATLLSCRTETAAELMCAEAILDISKTILPPSATGEDRPLPTESSSHSQSVLPSHQESDSNAVDSDDSIEQEIRAFLAIKAQAEHLITRSGAPTNASPNLLSSGQLDDQTERPKRPFPHTLKLPLLDHERKLKKENCASKERQDKPPTPLEMLCDHLDGDNRKKDVLTSVKNGETSGPFRQPEVSSVGFVSPLSQGLLGMGKHVKNTRQVLQKYGMDDKSSSLDSDEDLDTAIKDLLKSKRKLKKKSKDQKIQCTKKVRFGNTEMHIFEDKAEVLQEKDCKSKNPTLLKSCLVRSRRDIQEESTQKGPRYIVKGRPRRSEARLLPLVSGEGRCHPVSGPDSEAVAINDRHAWMAKPLMEDSSSLDSDDSIEQEIQRFLAEKAKDSSSAVGKAGAFGTADTLNAAQPRTAQPKAKHQQSEGRVIALLKQSKRAKMGCQPVAKLRSALRTERESAGTVSRIDEQAITAPGDIHSQAAGKLQGSQRIVQAKSAGLSVKRIAADRKRVSGSKLDQRSLPSWKEKAENCRLQNYFKSISLFRRKSPREFRISSKFIAGCKSAQKKKSVLLRKRRNIELPGPQNSLFWRQEGWLGEKCRTPVQKGILGSRCKAGGADLYLRCIAEELYPRVSEKMEVVPLSVAVVSLAKARPLGDGEFFPHADSKPSPLFQEPSTGDTRRVNISSAPAENPVRPKVTVSDPSISWEGHRTPKSCNSPLKGRGLLTHQDRIVEKQIQKNVGGGSAEFTGVSALARGQCLGKNKPSTVSIDPEWTVKPTISLSPGQLCESKSLMMQSRKTVLQVLGGNLEQFGIPG